MRGVEGSLFKGKQKGVSGDGLCRRVPGGGGVLLGSVRVRGVLFGSVPWGFCKFSVRSRDQHNLLLFSVSGPESLRFIKIFSLLSYLLSSLFSFLLLRTTHTQKRRNHSTFIGQ